MTEDSVGRFAAIAFLCVPPILLFVTNDPMRVLFAFMICFGCSLIAFLWSVE